MARTSGTRYYGQSNPLAGNGSHRAEEPVKQKKWYEEVSWRTTAPNTSPWAQDPSTNNWRKQKEFQAAA